MRVTEHVARGAVFVPFNQAGFAGEPAPRRSTSSTSVDRRARGGARRCRDRGRGLMDWLDWLLLVVRVVIVFFALLISVMLYIWMERKVIADMQTRMGPMRAGPRGVLITLADGIKLFFKEGIAPTNADRRVYLDRARPRDVPGVPGVLRDPVRDERHAVRPGAPVPARGSRHRHPVGARDDLDRRLRRRAGRMVERLELPAARRRPLDGADDLLRGGDGAWRSSPC